MSSHPNDKSTHEMEQLHARVQNLRHLLKHQLEKARRKLRNLLIAGVLLVLASATVLGNLTRLTFALDAQALTEIGRGQVEQHLPSGRLGMQSFLEGEAPRITRAVVSGVAASIPGFRPLIVEHVSEGMRGLASDIETRLSNEMRQVIKTSRSQVDLELTGATEAEKIARLVEVVAAQFEENAQGAFLALYPDYSAEMERVYQDLEDLRTKPAQSLSRKELLQREIIQTLLRLAIHSHQNQKDGGIDW